MRLVTFQQPGSAPEAGIVEGDKVQGLGVDMLTVCAAGRVPEARGPSFDLASVKLLAPVPRPPKLICVGLNYRDHAAESRSEIPKVPTIFSKFSNVVIGPGDPIVLPKASRKPDYEAEFAFVIGRGGRHIPAAQALDHVLGYTIVNDVSARDFQTATTQWLMGKTFDTFAPMGPWIVTKDEIRGPARAGYFARNRGRNAAEFQHPGNGVPHSGADRIRLDRGDARAGRRVRHGHSGGRWIRPETAALAEAGGRSDRAHRRHRRVEEPDHR